MVKLKHGKRNCAEAAIGYERVFGIDYVDADFGGGIYHLGNRRF